MEAAFAVMGGDQTPAEKKEGGAAVKKLVTEFEAKIKELLGPDDFARVKRYEDSQLERMQLQTFSGNLACKDGRTRKPSTAGPALQSIQIATRKAPGGCPYRHCPYRHAGKSDWKGIRGKKGAE